MTLFISTKRPDHSLDNSEIDTAIVYFAAKTALSRHSRQLPEGHDLEITFLYPGETERPPFSGMRMGGARFPEPTLHFEAAIPAHIARSGRAAEYLEALMEDVVDNAGEFFAGSPVLFDSERWRSAIKRLLP